MTEYLFDHDRFDVHQLSMEYVSNAFGHRSFIVGGFIAMLAINGVPESLASTLLASITSTSTALLSTSTKKCQNKMMQPSCR